MKTNGKGPQRRKTEAALGEGTTEGTAGKSVPQAGRWNKREIQKYTDAGFRLLPLDGKVPYKDEKTKKRLGLSHATDDPAVVAEWLRRWPDANLGGTPPEGMAIVDVDTYKCPEKLKPIAAELRALGGPWQRTQSGGAHFLVAEPVPSQGDLCKHHGVKGIDVRQHGRGYIVLAPSAGYEWRRAPWQAEAPPLPRAWLNGHAAPLPTAKGTAKSIPDLWNEREARKVKRALRRLDPDMEYPEWIRVGQALHSADPALDGPAFAAWDAWSSKASKYRGERDLRYHWQTFGQQGGLTLATLYGMAKDARQEDGEPDAGYVDQDGEAPLLRSFKRVQRTYRPPSFLIQNVLPERGLITVTGHPGGGKTTAMLFLVQCCLTGDTYAHGLHVLHPIEKAAVLCGDDYDGTVQRLAAYARENIFADLSDKLLIMEQAKPLDDDVVARLEAELDAAGVGLLLVDTGIAYASSDIESENDALGMQAYFSRLRSLARNRVVCVLAHPKHAAGNNATELIPRGSSAVLGTVDGNIAVWRGEADTVRMQSSPKWRGRGFELMFELRHVDSGYRDPKTDEPLITVVCSPVSETKRVAVATGRSHMVPLLRLYAEGGASGRDAIAKALGCSTDTVDKTRAKAVEKGYLRKQARGQASSRTSPFEITDEGRAMLEGDDALQS